MSTFRKENLKKNLCTAQRVQAFRFLEQLEPQLIMDKAGRDASDAAAYFVHNKFFHLYIPRGEFRKAHMEGPIRIIPTNYEDTPFFRVTKVPKTSIKINIDKSKIKITKNN